MKVLLLGSSGICAKYLLPYLIDNFNIKEIVGVSRSAEYYYEDHPSRGEIYIEVESQLDKKEWTFRLISDIRPDYILNFAGVSTSSSNVFDIWKNPQITLNLLESCVKLNHKVKFFQASSISVENYPLSMYSVSKLACENIVDSYNQLYPDLIKGIYVRYCAVVGANNKHGLLYDLVNKLRVDNNKITLFGNSPGSIKPFMYADNLAEILNNIFFSEEKFWGYLHYKLAPTDTLSVERVAEITMKLMGVNKEIEWDPTKTWRGDQRIIEPAKKYNSFADRILSSENAIKSALRDIL